MNNPLRKLMRKLLPDTIAMRAMLLLVLGLTASHLVSNLFYSTDRDNAILTTGGEHAIQWVAITGTFADEISPEKWSQVITSANSDHRFVTLTKTPVVPPVLSSDWREVALQRELANHVKADQLDRFRISYAPADSKSKSLLYWQKYLAKSGAAVPSEMILISMRLNNGTWLNVATPIRSPQGFFSLKLGLSMLVMIVAVTMIAAVIVKRMTEPLMSLSLAADKLGTDVQAPAIPETGPEEVRRTAHAFNMMQSRLRRFVEDRTQMLGAIAHDLATPLTRLRLRAEFLKDEEVRTKMLRDLDDMQHMVASTLSFIREDAASEPQASVDLGSLLARVCDDFTDSGADVSLDEIPRWVLVDCRPVALRRALGNLIGNAVKYGTRANVSLLIEPSKLIICIDDDGPGIPEARREDVFQPFHRLEQSRNFETGGTGLGLAVARTIIRAHGGDIHLTDCASGGLSAQLRLPRPHPHNQNLPAKSNMSTRTDTETKYNRHEMTDNKPSIQNGDDARLPKRRNTEWKTL
jgi:signal transduction histidine kinase